MKKLLIALILTLLLTLLFFPAFAEETAEAALTSPAITAQALVRVSEPAPLPTDPFSWEDLATIAGATMATLIIVQLLKLPLDRVWKIPTRIVAYVIALILLLLATSFTAGLTWSTGLLTAVNAVIVALAAMGAYEITFAKADHNGN